LVHTAFLAADLEICDATALGTLLLLMVSCAEATVAINANTRHKANIFGVIVNYINGL
jgi:hypothetical protein